jgi:DNA-binding transcriptional MocR family regulator
VVIQYQIKGRTASEIAANVEYAIVHGALKAGARLPPVRELAARLGVSSVTAASAYSRLKLRGLVVADGRRGTIVSHGAVFTARTRAPIPKGVRNLADGGPDPALLPDWRKLLAGLNYEPRGYGEAYNRPDLLRLGARMFHDDGIPGGAIAIVGGAMDGIERALQAVLRSGDRIAIEDPAYHMTLDLVRSLGLSAVPVGVDDSGILPDDLARALRIGVKGMIVTPRAQNPTGAALDEVRKSELRQLLGKYPEVMVIEDDHAGPIAGAPALSLVEPRRARWAVIRSVSKWLGPDLRLAFMSGDDFTIARVEARQHLGTGWVSHLLQTVVAEVLSDRRLRGIIEAASHAYTQRRESLIASLHAHGVTAHGRSGLNVWVPVPEETTAIRALLAAGWAVSAGERFRLNSGPALRISIAILTPQEAPRLASDLAHAFTPSRLIGSA